MKKNCSWQYINDKIYHMRQMVEGSLHIGKGHWRQWNDVPTL